MIKRIANPFITGRYGGQPVGVVTADDRVALVRKFNAEQCAAALRVDGLQKTVKAAIERRQRALQAAQSAAGTR